MKDEALNQTKHLQGFELLKDKTAVKSAQRYRLSALVWLPEKVQQFCYIWQNQHYLQQKQKTCSLLKTFNNEKSEREKSNMASYANHHKIIWYPSKGHEIGYPQKLPSIDQKHFKK